LLLSALGRVELADRVPRHGLAFGRVCFGEGDAQHLAAVAARDLEHDELAVDREAAALPVVRAHEACSPSSASISPQCRSMSPKRLSRSKASPRLRSFSA